MQGLGCVSITAVHGPGSQGLNSRCRYDLGSGPQFWISRFFMAGGGAGGAGANEISWISQGLCIYIYMYIYICILYIYIHTYVYVYTYIYIYIYIHI